jgi:hypothetical protein
MSMGDITDANKREGEGKLTFEAANWQRSNAGSGRRAQEGKDFMKDAVSLISSTDYANSIMGTDYDTALGKATQSFMQDNQMQLAYMDKDQQNATIGSFQGHFEDKYRNKLTNNNKNNLRQIAGTTDVGGDNFSLIGARDDEFNDKGKYIGKKVDKRALAFDAAISGGMGYDENSSNTEDIYSPNTEKAAKIDGYKEAYDMPKDISQKDASIAIDALHQKEMVTVSSLYEVKRSDKINSMIPKFNEIPPGSVITIDGKEISLDKLHEKIRGNLGYKEVGAMLTSGAVKDAPTYIDSDGNIVYAFGDTKVVVNAPITEIKNSFRNSSILSNAIKEGYIGKVEDVRGTAPIGGKETPYYGVEIAGKYIDGEVQKYYYFLDKDRNKIPTKSGGYYKTTFQEIKNADKEDFETIAYETK